ncbi:MAG TPA: ribokinase [Candidatus Nitrosopolaris sp.]|nr:ribokinase [Candidatus Nitrosopolaris sp.]
MASRKLAVVSNIVLYSLPDMGGIVTESLGGPAAYCGLTARRFSFDVILATKIGTDFPPAYKRLLLAEGIMIMDYQLAHDRNTTRFRFAPSRDNNIRSLLSSKCAQITIDEIEKIETDCWLVSPVIDEVPEEVLRAIIVHGGRKGFVMLDPQGYSRIVKSSGEVSSVNKISLDLSGVSAIKVDKTELALLTGGLEGLPAMQYLQSTTGIKFVISTEFRVIHLLYDGMHYWIQLKDIQTPDSTGVGDILCSAFCCAYLKENDPLWAFSFGAGAMRAALETRKLGLDKIPSKSKIEQSASYYYNTMSFRRA